MPASPCITLHCSASPNICMHCPASSKVLAVHLFSPPSHQGSAFFLVGKPLLQPAPAPLSRQTFKKMGSPPPPRAGTLLCPNLQPCVQVVEHFREAVVPAYRRRDAQVTGCPPARLAEAWRGGLLPQPAFHPPQRGQAQFNSGAPEGSGGGTHHRKMAEWLNVSYHFCRCRARLGRSTPRRRRASRS